MLRALKITLKVITVSVIYVFLMRFLAPASILIPGLEEIITTFTLVYVVLMIVSDVTAGTILQSFFNGVKALFVIGYLIVSLNSGILNITLGSVNWIIDIRVFLIVIMLLGLLGLARSIMQAISFASERIELGTS
jgi:hypothetical protein